MYVYVGDSTVLGIDDGRWKALSMQFTQAVIEDVAMKYGEGQIAVQLKANFFQAAELAGTGKAWPNGHAATVTFEAGTDMSAVRLDYGSINTYVVRTLDPNCVATVGSPCETAPAVYFHDMPPPAVVVFSGDAGSTRFGIYVFAEEEYIKQVSVGFTHSDVESWTISNTWTDMQVIHGSDAFGVYRLVGGSVPTGVPLTTVEAPSYGCMRACIDLEHINSNVESAHEQGVLHDVVYVFGSDLQLYDPPSPPPSTSPSPPPSTSPSPPPSTSNLYPSCSESDLLGDFNGNGYASA